MSLINDALKRAEESQPSVSPAAPACQAMRSVPDGSPPRQSRVWLPPVGGVLVLAAGLVAGIYFLRSAERTPDVRARTLPQATASAVPGGTMNPSAVQPSQKATTPEITQGANPMRAAVKHGAAAPGSDNAAPKTPDGVGHSRTAVPDTSHAAVAPAPARAGATTAPQNLTPADVPSPAAIAPVILAGDLRLTNLRLQAIIAHPTRPSAIVNGRTVFVGETVDGAKLVAVTTSSIRLSSPGGGEQVLHLGK